MWSFSRKAQSWRKSPSSQIHQQINPVYNEEIGLKYSESLSCLLMFESQTCLLQLLCLDCLLAFNRTSQILVFNECVLCLNVYCAINKEQNYFSCFENRTAQGTGDAYDADTLKYSRYGTQSLFLSTLQVKRCWGRLIWRAVSPQPLYVALVGKNTEK